jgi:hypothetical protein
VNITTPLLSLLLSNKNLACERLLFNNKTKEKLPYQDAVFGCTLLLNSSRSLEGFVCCNLETASTRAA